MDLVVFTSGASEVRGVGGGSSPLKHRPQIEHIESNVVVVGVVIVGGGDVDDTGDLGCAGDEGGDEASEAWP